MIFGSLAFHQQISANIEKKLSVALEKSVTWKTTTYVLETDLILELRRIMIWFFLLTIIKE